jgi:hypothetical protein
MGFIWESKQGWGAGVAGILKTDELWRAWTRVCGDGQPRGHGWEIPWCIPWPWAGFSVLGRGPESGPKATSRAIPGAGMQTQLLGSQGLSRGAGACGPVVPSDWWHLEQKPQKLHISSFLRLSLSRLSGSRDWGSHVAGEGGRSCRETVHTEYFLHHSWTVTWILLCPQCCFLPGMPVLSGQATPRTGCQLNLSECGSLSLSFPLGVKEGQSESRPQIIPSETW